MTDLSALSDVEVHERIWKKRDNLSWSDPLFDEKTRRWEAHRARFPRVFNDRYLDTEVGAGWWPTIIAASEKIEKVLDEYPGWRLCTLQLKEKFGGLRWYTRLVHDEAGEADDDEQLTTPDGLYERLYAITRAAAEEADRLCEVCGKPGETRSGGWIKTLCDEHAEQRKKRK